MPGVVKTRGFTLLELLVVVAIIGLLVGYVAPRYFSQVGKSEMTSVRAQIDGFEKALDTYRPDTGRPRVLVSGTVGFIMNLPHGLVASFKSILDEALEATSTRSTAAATKRRCTRSIPGASC